VTPVGKLTLLHTLHTGVAKVLKTRRWKWDGVLISSPPHHVQAGIGFGRDMGLATRQTGLDGACCGPQARGRGACYGKVYTAVRRPLVSADAKTGKLVWQTDPAKTHPEPKHYYTYTWRRRSMTAW